MSDSEEEEVQQEETMSPYHIRFSDMSEAQQKKAVKLVQQAFTLKMVKGEGDKAEAPKLDKDIAAAIKMKLDSDPDLADECAGWQVICGKSFASSLTYNTKHVIFFDLLDENKTYLLFKTQ